MTSSNKLINDIKWATRQRLQYIEIMAFYAGVVTRSDVAKAFGISDAAATKDLKLYGEVTKDNLLYKHTVFGFVPSGSFTEFFADLSPSTVLPMIAANLTINNGPYGDQPIYDIAADSLPLPARFPDKSVLAQLTRAIKSQKKARVIYHSLSNRDSSEQRIIEPHSLVNTGLRWHIRAYSEDTYDFRDFVLSRFAQAVLRDEDAESSAHYDDDWVEIITVKLAPHPKLNQQKRHNLLTDYSAQDGMIEVKIRRALVGYLLQRLSVDTTADHSQNPDKFQLIVMNRNEIEPFAGWAF